MTSTWPVITSSIAGPPPLYGIWLSFTLAIWLKASLSRRYRDEPLQYQKQLRLQEARELMLNQNLDAQAIMGVACALVNSTSGGATTDYERTGIG